ncbi:MAG: SCO family protein, partial [Arenimonas sp.]
GRPRVVSMFYTSCRVTCPLIVDSGKAVEHALLPSERARIGITLISLDPKRDTPRALALLAAKRGLEAARWSLLRPDESDVRALAGVLNVRYRHLADGDFSHTSALLLLDADGRVLARTDKVGSRLDPEFLTAVHLALAGAPALTRQQ